MATIQSVNSTNSRKPFINAKNTGYLAFVGMGLAMISAISKNKSFRKQHKPLSYFTGLATLLHLGVITHHNINKNKKIEFTA